MVCRKKFNLKDSKPPKKKYLKDMFCFCFAVFQACFYSFVDLQNIAEIKDAFLSSTDFTNEETFIAQFITDDEIDLSRSVSKTKI